MRKAISALTVAIALVLLARPAHADPGLVVDLSAANVQQADGLVVDGVVVAGRRLDIRASGCPAASTATFFLDDTALGSTKVDNAGVFNSRTQPVPYTTPSGPHRLKATCGRTIGPITINVRQPNTTPPQGRSTTLVVSRSAVTAGRTTILTGPSCDNSAPTAFLGGSRLVLDAPVRSGPLLKASATIPADTPAGSHQLLTRCNGVVTGVATLSVMPSVHTAPPPSRAGIPRRSILPGLSAGLALILVGALTLMSIKRRRTRTATPGYFDLASPDR
jgi:hypothetical protein